MAVVTTFTEITGNGYVVAMIGVGAVGLEAVKTYSPPVYGDEKSVIQALTLCDDRAFRHKRKSKIFHPTDSPVYLAERRKEVINACRACDVLIVFADIDQDPDFDFACRFGNLYRMGEHDFGFSICVTCARSNTFAAAYLRNYFDNVIYTCSSAAEMCRPIEMLLTDLYTQAIALDVADVRSALRKSPELYFTEKRCATRHEVGALLDELYEDVIDKIALSELNYLAYMSNSSLDGLPNIRDVYDAFVDEGQNGEQLFQMGYNKDAEDRSTKLSFLYGQIGKHNDESADLFDESEWLSVTGGI